MKASGTFLLIAIALLSAVVTGCETTDDPKAPGAATPDPLPDHAYPQIAALEGLDKYLSYGEVIVRGGHDPAQPLAVTVPIRARTDTDLNVQYRFEFFDAGDRPLEPMMEWRYMKMQARVMQFMEGSSLDPAADDWRLVIRPAR